MKFIPKSFNKAKKPPKPKTIATLVVLKSKKWALVFDPIKEEKLKPKEGKGDLSVVARFVLESGVDEESGKVILLRGFGREVSLLAMTPKEGSAAAAEDAEEIEAAADADDLE